MKAFWLEAALNYLEAAIISVADYSFSSALKLDDEVAQLVDCLEESPFSGRTGRVEGTREVSAGNYVLVYRVIEARLEILSFIHGADKYPPFPSD